MDEHIERTLQALKRNGMEPHFVQTRAEIIPLLETLLQAGDTVGTGGSITLSQCGIPEYLGSGRYDYLDRYAPNLSPEDLGKLYRAVFSADAYLTSSNAITEDGALVNVDGNSNRVAAMAFGPRRVIVIAGVNKIVPDEAAALRRVAEIAAPRNAQRLGCKTPCAVTGTCQNCNGADRICCTYVTQRRQRVLGRMQIVLVNESLGY